jgi:hypothetical protein
MEFKDDADSNRREDGGESMVVGMPLTCGGLPVKCRWMGYDCYGLWDWLMGWVLMGRQLYAGLDAA